MVKFGADRHVSTPRSAAADSGESTGAAVALSAALLLSFRLEINPSEATSSEAGSGALVGAVLIS